MLQSSVIYYAIIIYILIVVGIYLYKPSFMYDYENNKFKEFGFTEEKTMFSLPVMAIILSIIIYLVILHFSDNDISPVYSQQVPQLQPIQQMPQFLPINQLNPIYSTPNIMFYPTMQQPQLIQQQQNQQ